MNRTDRTVRLTKMAMLSAISIALMLMIRLPFPPFPAFVYDPADIPIIISGFAFGPLSGIMITIVVSFIQAFILGGDQVIGFFMHVMATGSFVLVAGLIYKTEKTKKRAIIALVVGSLLMTVVMIGWNLIVTPFYLMMPRKVVVGMILPAILPFNLLKAAINSAVTFLIYKPIARFLHK